MGNGKMRIKSRVASINPSLIPPIKPGKWNSVEVTLIISTTVTAPSFLQIVQTCWGRIDAQLLFPLLTSVGQFRGGFHWRCLSRLQQEFGILEGHTRRIYFWYKSPFISSKLCFLRKPYTLMSFRDNWKNAAIFPFKKYVFNEKIYQEFWRHALNCIAFVTKEQEEESKD